MEIGDRIRKRRLELDMTQDELAKSAGYASRVSINKIELDGRKIPQNRIKLIAKALKTTPSYLLDWKDSDDGPASPVLPSSYHSLDFADRIAIDRIIEGMLQSDKYAPPHYRRGCVA
jgi:transcriptional regulator with XRE-family HTH domain